VSKKKKRKIKIQNKNQGGESKKRLNTRTSVKKDQEKCQKRPITVSEEIYTPKIDLK